QALMGYALHDPLMWSVFQATLHAGGGPPDHNDQTVVVPYRSFHPTKLLYLLHIRPWPLRLKRPFAPWRDPRPPPGPAYNRRRPNQWSWPPGRPPAGPHPSFGPFQGGCCGSAPAVSFDGHP